MRARLGFDVDAGLIVDRRRHLRRDEAIPDQLVELELLVLEVLPARLGRELERRRADRLVRVLRVLLRLEDVRLLGQVTLCRTSVSMYSRTSSMASSLTRSRVGTHVRDETDRAAVLAEVDAFVEPLRDLHRALGAEAQVARRVLLELGRRVRRGRLALLLASRDLRDAVAARSRGRRAPAAAVVAVLDLELLAVGA